MPSGNKNDQTDEHILATIRLFDATDRKIRCFMRKGETINQDIILEKKEKLWLSQCTWLIFGQRRTPLIRLQNRITADTYIRDVQEEYVMPCFLERPNSNFMQDNAPPYRAILTKDFF